MIDGPVYIQKHLTNTQGFILLETLFIFTYDKNLGPRKMAPKEVRSVNRKTRKFFNINHEVTVYNKTINRASLKKRGQKTQHRRYFIIFPPRL